jgi:hypothetical protein
LADINSTLQGAISLHGTCLLVFNCLTFARPTTVFLTTYSMQLLTVGTKHRLFTVCSVLQIARCLLSVKSAICASVANRRLFALLFATWLVLPSCLICPTCSLSAEFLPFAKYQLFANRLLYGSHLWFAICRILVTVTCFFWLATLCLLSEYCLPATFFLPNVTCLLLLPSNSYECAPPNCLSVPDGLTAN